MGNEREFKVKITVDAAGATAGSAQAAQGFEKTAAAVGKAADEAERYQQALQKMAEQQAATQTKGVSSEDQAMIDKAAERRQELAERKKLSAEADREIAAGVRVVGQEEVDAVKKVEAANEEAFASKRQLKDAVKGLQMQFPVLASVARMAMNPITAAVALATSAWWLWKSAVDACVRSLVGFEMPDVSESRLKPIRDAAQAWRDYATAIADAARKYGEAEASGQLALAQIKAETDQRLALITAIKDLAAARLEAEKPTLPAGEYERRKAENETGAQQAEAATRWQGQQEEWYAKNERVNTLRQEEAAKNAAAGQIKVGEPEEYAAVEKGYNDAAREAEKKLKESQEFVGALREFQQRKGSIPNRVHTEWKAMRALGMPYASVLAFNDPKVNELIEREYRTQSDAQMAIGNARNFNAAQKVRGEARNQRARLLGEAGAAGAAAITGNLELGELAETMTAAHAAEQRNDVLAALAAAYRALAEVRTQAKELQDQVVKDAETGRDVMTTTIDKLMQLNAEKADLEKRVRQMEGSAPRTY